MGSPSSLGITCDGGDEYIFTAALTTIFILSSLTFLSLQFLTLPYGGRHSRNSSWGPSLPTVPTWILMESPTLWVTLLVYPSGRHSSNPISITIISLYLLHYLHRTIIYPIRAHFLSGPKQKPRFPLSIAVFAFFLNILIAYLQSRSASRYAPAGAAGWSVWARAVLGAAIFLWGMSVNIRSDMALVRLKAEAGGGYRIPKGGWFEMVACPNYMGEVAEWLGWAVLAWSPAALAFFFFTFSNLGPRARSNLSWYRHKFGAEYPADRKAILPFVY